MLTYFQCCGPGDVLQSNRWASHGLIRIQRAAVASCAANDASFFAERNDPTAGTVGPCKLIRTHCIGDATAHSLRLGVDRRANEITLDPDEDWPQVEASKRLLVGGSNVGIDDWACAGDDPADQSAHGARFLQLPYRGCIQQCSGPVEVVLEPSRKWLMSEALERASRFGVA